MTGNRRTYLAVAMAIIVIGTGYAAYHVDTTHTVLKGQIITLSTGYNHTAPLTRIVSLDPAATATIYAIGAYGNLVGGNQYDSYPPNSTLPNVTDYPSMDLEAIFNLSPQAVISFSNYSGSQISALLNASIDYIFINSGAGSTFSNIEQQNTLLGRITGQNENASKLNMWMNQSLNTLYNGSANLTKGGEMSGFYYLDSYGGIWTAGNNTFIDRYFHYAHIRNIAEPYSSNFYVISPEEVLNGSPQIIFLNPYVNYSSLSAPPFNTSAAYINNRTYTIPSDSLFDEPNFRDIFAIQWMIYETYGKIINVPAFPLNVKYNPNPTGI